MLDGPRSVNRLHYIPHLFLLLKDSRVGRRAVVESFGCQMSEHIRGRNREEREQKRRESLCCCDGLAFTCGREVIVALSHASKVGMILLLIAIMSQIGHIVEASLGH